MKRLAAARVAALALSAVLALSACAVTGQPARPGTAATYDGATITTEQVAAWGTAQNDMGFAYDPGAVLTLLLLLPALDKEAAIEGIAFGDDQVTSEANQWMTAGKADVVVPTKDMMDVVRTARTFEALVLTKPGAEAIQAAITSIEANAVINPAYGDFTYERVVATVRAQAQAQQDGGATYGDVSYLVFKDVSGFDPNAQRGWMVDEGSPSASPAPIASPSPAP